MGAHRTARHDDPDEVIALRLIRDSLTDRGYPPSQREIAAACGWASPSQGHNLTKLLQARGLLDVAPGIPRGLRVTQQGLEYITGAKMVADTETV